MVIRSLLLALLAALAAAAPALATSPRIADSPADIRPLLVGQRIPDVTLQGVDGQWVKMEALVGNQPAVMVFFEGGDSPYASRQLEELGRVEPLLARLGYRIVAISPDSPETLAASVDDGARYTLLSDPKLEAVRAFGLAYGVPRASLHPSTDLAHLASTALGQSTDVVALPVPGVFVVTGTGRVVHQYVNVETRVPLSGEVLLTAARVYGGR